MYRSTVFVHTWTSKSVVGGAGMSRAGMPSADRSSISSKKLAVTHQSWNVALLSTDTCTVQQCLDTHVHTMEKESAH